MDRDQIPQSGHSFHRGNYKLRYTPDEEAYVKTYVFNWMRTKGLLSSVLGGGFSYLLMKSGAVGPKYGGLKIATGVFTGFTLARFYAMGVLHQELKEKYPDGYAAQMFYLRDHHDAFQDFMAYARDQQRRGYQFTPADRFPGMPSRQPVTNNNVPEPVTTVNRDYQESPSVPAGLDDRFRPQMDGLLQGRSSLPDEDDKTNKKPTGSYAMWRQHKSPPPPDQMPGAGLSSGPPPYSQPPDLPRYPPPPDISPPPSSQTDSFQNPSSYEAPLPRRASRDPPTQKKPVKRNRYGDIIEDE